MSRTTATYRSAVAAAVQHVLRIAAIHVVLVRFSEDTQIVRDFVHLKQGVDVDKRGPNGLLATAVWGMIHDDDTGIVSRSAEGHAKMVARGLSLIHI